MRPWLLCAALTQFAPLTTMAADISAPHLNGSVSLDGRLEEPMWRSAARLPHTAFTRWVNNTYDKDQAIFHLRFFHDGRLLYVALASYDRYVEAGAAPENADGLYSLSITTRTGKLKHYRLRWSKNPLQAGGDMLNSRRWGARLRGPYQKPTQPGGGYVIEFAIPLWEIGWMPGDTLPLNIIVNDHNGQPEASYRSSSAEFARFAWGSFDNESRTDYRTLKLAP